MIRIILICRFCPTQRGAKSGAVSLKRDRAFLLSSFDLEEGLGEKEQNVRAPFVLIAEKARLRFNCPLPVIPKKRIGSFRVWIELRSS